MKIIDKVAWIYIKDKKVLCTLTKGKEKYYSPGGKREGNETDEETLIREVKEEVSVDIRLDTIKYYGTFEAQADGKEDGVIVKMTCYMAEYEGELKPDSEIERIDFLNTNDIDKLSLAGKLIFEDLKEKGLIN
ncbi:MAG: NUDIX domain-containing protein [Clostridia bacterium]|nr:NUDIX domain-containing protein [Clostridia bacterium]